MKLAFRAFMAEWSKALVLRSSIDRCVGSNPTECKTIISIQQTQILNNKNSMEIAKQVWSYSVVVSTRDFESRDLGSTPSKT